MSGGKAASGTYERKLSPGTGATTLFYGMIAIGVLTFVLGLATDAGRLWRSYLLHNMMFLGLSVGALVFLVTHYLAASGWFVMVRRIAEAMAGTLRYAFVTTLVLFLGLSKLYPWFNHETMVQEHFDHSKQVFFGTGFFAARVVAFFAVTLFFSYRLLRNSLRQDTEGGMELRTRQKPLSAGFLVTFAPLFTVLAIDLVKSLEPAWYSTMFGVYMFSGYMQFSMAVMILIVFFLKRAGYMESIREDHLHDMSKYMFGWSIFWAYICFSQFMLIWYANTPEENFYFVRRMNGSWECVGALLALVKFVFPFLLLLPRAAKRCLNYATAIACLVVFSEWLDLNWMVMPSYSPSGFIVGWQDVGMFIGFTGLFGLGVRRFLAANNMVPVKDPFLHESEQHHVIFA